EEGRYHGHRQPGARQGDGDDRGRGDGPQGQAGEAGGSGVLSRRDRRAARDRGAATPAGGDRDGTRRSRQDLAPRLYPAHEGGGGGGGRDHAAYRRLSRRDAARRGDLSR